MGRRGGSDDGSAKTWLELLNTLVWPLLVTSVVLLFFEPLKSIATLLPDKLRESKKISVGSLSFEVEEKIAEKGDLRAAAGVRNLTKEAIALLLNSPGVSRWVSTSDDRPEELSLSRLKPVTELVNAGFLRVYYSRRNYNSVDLSNADIQKVLAAGASDQPESAFEELNKRGYSGIVSELIRATSKDTIAWLLGFTWKKPSDNDDRDLIIDQHLTDAARARILSVDYELSPSGRHLYDAMVSVVSEQMSASEAGSAKGPTATASAHPLASSDPTVSSNGSPPPAPSSRP
jgi:hypothetical protein